MKRMLASLAAIAVIAGPVHALAQSSENTGPVDRAAIDALERMGAYLRSLKAFKVSADTATDYVLEDGQKLQTSGHADLTVRRPDRLFAEVKTDQTVRQLFYDGKTFTLFAPAIGYYASDAAPATLGEMVDALERERGIDLPLADLFHWGTDKADVKLIKTAMVLEPAEIGGETCDHFAFQQEDVDWQIWIRQGDQALPCKLIVVSKDDAAQPAHSSVLAWAVDASVPDATFTFTPPADSAKIEIIRVDEEESNGGSQ